MPRRAKRTQAGYTAQPTAPVQGQRYGEGKAQQELQQQMPTPNTRIQPVAGPPAHPAASALGQVVPGGASTKSGSYHPGDDTALGAAQRATPEQLAQIAAQMRSQVGLFNGTDRPNEPVTAGLPFGPGPGPEALQVRRGSPVANTIAELARQTGDSYLAELVARSSF